MLIIKNKLKIFWVYIRRPYDWIVSEIKYRKKIKELKEQDPFIYE